MKLADWRKALPLLAIVLYGLWRATANSVKWLVTSVPRDIKYTTPVVGQVTRRSYNRGRVYIYLNDDGFGVYNFFDFRPAHTPLPHAVLDTAQLGEINRHGLMHLLQEGDSVVKRANDSLLVVSRAGRRIYWVCSPTSPAP